MSDFQDVYTDITCPSIEHVINVAKEMEQEAEEAGLNFGGHYNDIESTMEEIRTMNAELRETAQSNYDAGEESEGRIEELEREVETLGDDLKNAETEVEELKEKISELESLLQDYGIFE